MWWLVLLFCCTCSYATAQATDATFVSAFFNLAARDTSRPFKRSLDTYVKHAATLLSYPGDYVFFCDQAACPSFAPLFSNRTQGRGIVVQIELEDFPHADILPAYLHNMVTSQGTRHAYGKVGGYYEFLMAAKLHLMVHAINLNPYNTGSFVWVDAGLAHVSDVNQVMALNRPWGKIRFVVSKPLLQRHLDNNDNMVAAMADGIIAGAAEYYVQLLPLFDARLRQEVARGWYPHGELMLPVVMNLHPHLFDAVIGTYASIVHNFVAFRLLQSFLYSYIDQARTFESHSYGYHLCAGILDAYVNGTLLISTDLEATHRRSGIVVIPPVYLYKLYFSYFYHAYWTYVGPLGIPNLGLASPTAVEQRLREFMRTVAASAELAALVYVNFDVLNANFDFYPRYPSTNTTLAITDVVALYTPGVALSGPAPDKQRHPQVYLNIFNVQL